MSPIRAAGAGAPATVSRRFSRENLIVGAALAAAALLAWFWLLRSPMGAGASMSGMEAMDQPPLSLGYIIPAFTMWSIMMVAMMIPSAAPMVLLRARIDRNPSARVRSVHTLLFLSAYLLVWTLFSAAAATAQAALVASGAISATELSFGSRLSAAGLLFAGAGYELSAAKRLCLDTCQSPVIFVLKYRRPGAAGAFRLGIVHGLYCLGCCWTLMLLLFVGGVMNLAWVALLGIAVLGEKLARPRFRAQRYVAAALALGGIAVLAA